MYIWVSVYTVLHYFTYCVHSIALFHLLWTQYCIYAIILCTQFCIIYTHFLHCVVYPVSVYTVFLLCISSRLCVHINFYCVFHPVSMYTYIDTQNCVNCLSRWIGRWEGIELESTPCIFKNSCKKLKWKSNGKICFNLILNMFLKSFSWIF